MLSEFRSFSKFCKSVHKVTASEFARSPCFPQFITRVLSSPLGLCITPIDYLGSCSPPRINHLYFTYFTSVNSFLQQTTPSSWITVSQLSARLTVTRLNAYEVIRCGAHALPIGHVGFLFRKHNRNFDVIFGPRMVWFW